MTPFTKTIIHISLIFLLFLISLYVFNYELDLGILLGVSALGVAYKAEDV